MKGKSTAIVVIGIVVLLIIGFAFVRNMRTHETTAMLQHSSPSVQPTTNPSPSGAMMNHDTSNQQLDSDTKDIQNTLNNLQTDQTNVDQSINQSGSDQLTY